MIQTLKKNIALFVAAAVLLLGFSLVAVMPAGAADIQESVCSGANEIQLGGTSDCVEGQGEDELNALITNIVNIFSVIVGVISVIMIIYGGFRYITSGGDSTHVGSAKNTIMYAIIGLVIVALAQIIVRFVLGQATSL